MTNDIFSFSILRPFQKTDKNSTRAKTIKSYAPQHNSQLFKDLKAAKAANDRDAMVTTAKAFVDAAEFIADPKTVAWPLHDLEQWLSGNERYVTKDQLEANVSERFKAAGVPDWKAWLTTAAYKNSVGKLSDSLIAASIVGDGKLAVKAARPKLVRCLRLCALLERLAGAEQELASKDGIALAMKALVLLPGELFPLPPKDTQKERKALADAHEQNNKLMLERQAKVLELVDQLGKLREAKIEINTLHRQLSRPEQVTQNEQRLKVSEEAKRATGFRLSSLFGGGGAVSHEFRTERDTSWRLTPTALAKVTDPTKKSLGELGIDLQQADVRSATGEIERRIAAMSATLHAGTPKTKTVKIGSNFLSQGIVMPSAIPGIKTIQPAPGSFDIQLAAPAESPVVIASTVPMGKGDVKPIGYSELYVVRETLQKYIPGEVAHIENILKGEDKEREHRRLTESEETTELDREQVSETERDLQSTSRFDLQITGQEAVQESISVRAGVSGSYKTPAYEIKAEAGFAYERAVQESSSTASTVSHEVIDKAVSKTRERVREARRRRTLETIEETNSHRILNSTAPAGNIVGIYRWVNEVHKVEVVNIGRRLMFEFIVPEPAAFYKHSQLFTPIEGVTLEKPEPPLYQPTKFKPQWPFLFNIDSDPTELRPLEPQDLNDDNYMHWVAKYNVQDASPPPPEYKIIGIGLNEKPASTDNLKVESLGDLTVEQGYEAESAYVGGTMINHQGGYFRAAIGRNSTELWGGAPLVLMNGESGKLPVTAIYYNMAAIGVTIEVTCRRTEAKLAEWRLKTFTSIMNAYNDLKSRYDEQVAAAQTQAGVAISGRNPLKNREIEETELKKLSLSMLTGQQFDSFDAMRKSVGPLNYPQMDISEATLEGKYIQFFEQAFEWHHMSYLFYPYFWGRKEHWIDTLNLSDVDPKFEKFLQAGAARVLVPVRPGYEQVVMHYLETETGEIWEGGDPPHVDDELYVLIVDAIKEQQGQYTVEGPGELSVTKYSAIVSGTATSFTSEDDENREMVIGGEVYRIDKVESRTRIELDRKYQGDTKGGLPYELGVKHVGEPWEITVPTSLVWLQEKPELPDFTKP